MIRPFEKNAKNHCLFRESLIIQRSADVRKIPYFCAVRNFFEVPFSKIIDNQQEKVKNIYEQSSKQRFFIIDNFPFSLYK